MANQSLVSVPPNVENPRVLQRFLTRLVERLDVVLGNRADEGYVSQEQLVAQAAAFGGTYQYVYTWVDFRDGHLEYIEYDNPDVTTPLTFDTAKAELIFSSRVDQDQSYTTSALFEDIS